MELPQANLPKKRRRWLIVAFVLVLVSLVSWCYWPRGDARFVGKWHVRLGHFGVSPPAGTMELHSNGLGVVDYSIGIRRAPKTYFQWRTTGDVLHLGTTSQISSTGFWQFVTFQFKRFTGSRIELRPTVLDVESIDENTIKFRRPERPGPILVGRLTRFPQ